MFLLGWRGTLKKSGWLAANDSSNGGGIIIATAVCLCSKGIVGHFPRSLLMSTKNLSGKDCRCCVFSHSRCALGMRRSFSGTCGEFQPYCLDCYYPDWLCHTCQNRPQKKLKPQMPPRSIGHGQGDGFHCTW